MAKKGRHTFVIPKGETPVKPAAANHRGNMQDKLRAFGAYSRVTKFGREWPSNFEKGR